MDSKSAILIADDSAMQRNLIKKMLHSHGYVETLEAQDGKQVLDLLMEYKVDLIISGISMQKVNGLELLKALKNHSSLKSIPFMVMSLESEDNVVEKIMAAGAVDFIKKPFSQADLIKKISSVLTKQ